jgi:hypothetical protein
MVIEQGLEQTKWHRRKEKKRKDREAGRRHSDMVDLFSYFSKCI